MIDRVLDELWNEVRDIIQETGIKTIPKEKKCKKAKQLSEEALQIAFLLAFQQQRHHFANKCPSSQGYGFFSGHVWK